jgi:hypothetical protein
MNLAQGARARDARRFRKRRHETKVITHLIGQPPRFG